MVNTPQDSSKSNVEKVSAKAEHSKVNTVWVSIAFIVVLLALFVTFVAQNAQNVTVHFLWLNGTISLALALIIATLVGAVVTFIVGSIRIWQLNRKNNLAKKNKV